jgi:hypothetical protein
LHSIYYKEEFTLVILVIGYERVEFLVNISIHDFCLTVYFLIVSSRQLKLNINNSIKLILEAKNKLRSTV